MCTKLIQLVGLSLLPRVGITNHGPRQLRRNLSLLTILGLSFTIIAAPFGLVYSASFSLINGGVTYFWGWVFLSLITVCMAASLGELCSAWPTSGGVYVWSAYTSPKRVRRIISFCNGWVGIVANITLQLSIAFGEAQLIMATVSIFRDNEWSPQPWQQLLTFFAVMATSCLINLFGVRYNYLERLNTASIYWSTASVIVIMVVLLVMAGRNPGTARRSGHDALLLWQNSSGWTDGWSFFVGCLTSAYVLTGYGCVASLCEEVNEPERAVPRAMLGSVLAASASGLLFILPVIFTLPNDISDYLSLPSGPIPALFKDVTGSSGGGFGLLFLMLVFGMFSAVGGLTVALRSVWAFSRDGGLPFSHVLAKVDPTLQLPVNATLTSTAIICSLGLISLGSTAALSAFTGAATICLGVSYAIPITMSMLRSRKLVANAPWNMGNVGGWIVNVISVVWILFSIVLFSFPTTKTTEVAQINYASVVFCAFFCFAALYYAFWGRKVYTGPLILSDEDEALENEASSTTSAPLDIEVKASR
ncbi:unnamed protein product [Parajaminaea phylloscopi]